jgi:hypothetical protein
MTAFASTRAALRSVNVTSDNHIMVAEVDGKIVYGREYLSVQKRIPVYRYSRTNALLKPERLERRKYWRDPSAQFSGGFGAFTDSLDTRQEICKNS